MRSDLAKPGRKYNQPADGRFATLPHEVWDGFGRRAENRQICRGWQFGQALISLQPLHRIAMAHLTG